MRTVHGLALTLVALGCTHTLRVPMPTAGGPGARLPPPTPSRIDAPVSADLRETLRALEAQVPRELGTDGQYRSVGPFPASVRYSVRRGPFRFTPTQGGLHAEATLEFSAEACVGAALGLPIPFLGGGCAPVGSCGMNGESPRRVVIATDTTVRLDPSWRLVAETVAAAPRFLDRCELTPFHIDVSGVVAGVVAQEVRAATARMDADVNARGDLRGVAEPLWRNLAQPMELGEGAWLALSPRSVAVSSFTLDTERASANVQVTAHPVVTVGDRPAAEATALPDITAAGDAREGFRLTFDATVGWGEVSRLVAERFRGQTLTLEGHRVLVREIRAVPHGHALMFLLDVRFEDGAFAGQTATVHLAGLPAYDAARRELVVRELDYSLETRSAMLEFGEWFLRGSLRAQIAAQARFPLGDRVDRVRASAARALTRELGGGTRMEGSLGEVRPGGAYVTEQGVALRVEVEGRVQVTQDLSSLRLTGR